MQVVSAAKDLTLIKIVTRTESAKKEFVHLKINAT